jgi:EAL domain-containing protein (putative c-di-GMP-specific phosphodiesterase class I)
MDALTVLDKLEQLQVVFEPIYSADEHIIVAYEAISSEFINDEQFDIEAFIYNDEVPEEIRMEIEQLYVKQAIEFAKEELGEVDYGESYFTQLKELVDESLLKNITLVMNEHLYKGEMKHLHHVVKYIKTYGVKVALNNVGVHSQLDAIFSLEPSVLKINVSQLNYNSWGNQNHVFTTIRTLAVKMGASLLVGGVDTIYQLQHAWKNGARYYKGAYLEKPSKDFKARETLKPRFKDECEQFIATEKKIIRQKFEAEKELEKIIVGHVQHVQPLSEDHDSIMRLAKSLQNYAFRLYMCDGEGFQTTPNIVQRNGEWFADKKAERKNWSWRPYFLQNLLKLRQEHQISLSIAYSDIETEELTRTISMALPNNEYLFIDIAYSYLYENNIVN